MILKLTALWLLLSTVTLAQHKATPKTNPYFPTAQSWVRKTPTDMGLAASKIQEAIAFHRANEIKNPRSMEQSHYQSFGKEPYGYADRPFCRPGRAHGRYRS